MKSSRMMKCVVVTSVLMVFAAILLGTMMSSAFAAEPAGTAAAATPSGATGWVAIAIAISVASGALGAGYAVGKVGSAAIGAASERPEMMGRALVFVVIAEGIAVWGLVGAILLIGKL